MANDDIYIGGRQLHSSHPVSIKADTDPPDPDPSVRVNMNVKPVNPVRPHPIENWFDRPKGVRHQMGRNLPKASQKPTDTEWTPSHAKMTDN